MDRKPVTSLNITNNVALVTIDRIPNNIHMISEIFTTIANEKVNIDMISQTPPYGGNVNISFSLPSDMLVRVISALNKFKKKAPQLRIDVDADNTKLSIYGEEMKNIPGVAARLFTLLAEHGVEIKLVTTSEVDISYLIYEKDEDKAIEAIKKEYGLI